MGEAAKPEETKQEEANKPEEPKPEEKKEEKADEKKEETPPSPPPPIVLFVDLHCVGCAKKIQRSILKCRGVEEVEIDMVKNQVTVKGIVDPQVLCSRIEKKTLRKAKVLSPLPPEDGSESTKSEVVVASQVGGISTVELQVNMHCDACSQQLKKKILKMRGVQTAETELKGSKVTVTGTMNGEKLVDYIYRRTGKLAKIIPPPPPPPPPPNEEEKKEGEKKEEEKAAEDQKKEEEKKEEEKKEDDQNTAEKKEEENGDGGGGGGKEADKKGTAAVEEEQKKEGTHADQIMNGGVVPLVFHGDHHDMVKRMVYWTPMYVIEQPPPPPQLFSDENPNACCIS